MRSFPPSHTSSSLCTCEKERAFPFLFFPCIDLEATAADTPDSSLQFNRGGISPSGEPGSPYRGSLNGLNQNGGAAFGRPNLSKELVQRLRSMTETIKMLSEENAELRKWPLSSDGGDKRREDYEDLSRDKLISLVVAYDEKLKALSGEVAALSAKTKVAEDKERVSAGPQDKYKALARRLKEERNRYKESLEEKLSEQKDLKEEMEKMSDLVCELRGHCQDLQERLLDLRGQEGQQRRPSSSIGVQVEINIKQQVGNVNAAKVNNVKTNNR